MVSVEGVQQIGQIDWTTPHSVEFVKHYDAAVPVWQLYVSGHSLRFIHKSFCMMTP